MTLIFIVLFQCTNHYSSIPTAGCMCQGSDRGLVWSSGRVLALERQKITESSLHVAHNKWLEHRKLSQYKQCQPRPFWFGKWQPRTWFLIRTFSILKSVSSRCLLELWYADYILSIGKLDSFIVIVIR